MKKNQLILYFVLLFFGSSCSTMTPNRDLSQREDLLESGFIVTPDSIQTSVYWYWISDNISKEGVVKDLNAMKQVGINRAFIGNIGLENSPYGKVKIFSDEWWEILHLALKTASELDIEIGIFNSPGWSQSGGPWIKPEESMRYLTSNSIIVDGPGLINKKIEKPTDFFQDVKTLAFPIDVENLLSLNQENTDISSFPSVGSIESIIDGDINSGISFPSKGDFTVNFKLKTPITLRSLTIYPTKSPLNITAVFESKNKDDSYTKITEFNMNRSNIKLHVGFKPFAPVVITIPETNATEYRITFKNVNINSGIAEIILSSEPKVERYAEKTFAKMHPTPLPLWDAYLWREQPQIKGEYAINSNAVLDISNHLTEDGMLTWNAPAGKWRVLRMGMTTTKVTNGPASPEGVGLEVDKMSKEMVKRHFDCFIGEILRRIPKEDRSSFKVVVQDSYETGGQNFTDSFIQDFKNYYGYDPVPYLPVYEGHVINDHTNSDRFLWDMRRLVANKVAYDYVGGLREISNQNGLTTWLENYGHWGFPGEFLMYGGQSDEIAGEFWSQGNLGDIENRAATSAGHIYGKNKISAESNTSGGPAYSRHPANMKQRMDRFFAEGINNTLLHVYIMQAYEDKNPGVNAWFGNEFDRKNTWFSYMDLFTEYIKRVNFMLQQGLNVADVAYFIGEDAPKMTGITDPPLPIGYQFDYINAEVIERDMTVENGLITLPHGTQYKVLVLPKLETMRPELLKKIQQLVKDGAIVLGPDPSKSPSLQNQPNADIQVKNIADKLWDDVDGVSKKYRKVGKGMIINGMNMDEVFELIQCVPDCKLPEDNTIHFGHRTLRNGTEIYFLTNQTDKQQFVTPEFRVKNLQPELWEPTTGKIRHIPSFKNNKNTTTVPMKFEPYESAFVVFRKTSKKKGNTLNVEQNFPAPAKSEQLIGPWKLSFSNLLYGQIDPVVIDTLADWTKFSENKIKYYSGEASYSIDFSIQDTDFKKIMLNLGDLTSMAKIYLNDEYVGGVWTFPYALDISEKIKNGNNTLKIKVVNNWMNRLIGDAFLPANERKTWTFVNPYNKKSKLQPSGLFGPVKINYY